MNKRKKSKSLFVDFVDYRLHLGIVQVKTLDAALGLHDNSSFFTNYELI